MDSLFGYGNFDPEKRGSYVPNDPLVPGHGPEAFDAYLASQGQIPSIKRQDYINKQGILAAQDYPTPIRLGGMHFTDSFTGEKSTIGGLLVHDPVAMQAIKDMKKEPLSHAVAHEAAKTLFGTHINATPNEFIAGRNVRGRYDPDKDYATFTTSISPYEPPTTYRDTTTHELQHALNQVTPLSKRSTESWQGYVATKPSVDEAIAYAIANGGSGNLADLGFSPEDRALARQIMIQEYGDQIFQKYSPEQPYTPSDVSTLQRRAEPEDPLERKKKPSAADREIFDFVKRSGDIDKQTGLASKDYPLTEWKHFGNLSVLDPAALQTLKDTKNKDFLSHEIAHRASKLPYETRLDARPDYFQATSPYTGLRGDDPDILGEYHSDTGDLEFTTKISPLNPPDSYSETMRHELQHAINAQDPKLLEEKNRQINEAVAYGMEKRGTAGLFNKGFSQEERQAAREKMIQMYGNMLFKQSGGNIGVEGQNFSPAPWWWQKE